MCYWNTARKFNTQCNIHNNSQVMNNVMLRRNFMITLETDYTQLEARNNFLSCCVLAHTAGVSSLFSRQFSVVKIYVWLVTYKPWGSWLRQSLIFDNTLILTIMPKHSCSSSLSTLQQPGWSKLKVSTIPDFHYCSNSCVLLCCYNLTYT